MRATSIVFGLIVLIVIVDVSHSFLQHSARFSLQQNIPHNIRNLPGNIPRNIPGNSRLEGARRIDVGTGEGVIAFGKDMLNHELLTANDEKLLSRQYKLGQQVKAQRKVMATELGRDITDAELATALGLSSPEHVNILIDKGRDSKKLLVKANMRLVFHICKFYRYRGVAYPDLVQEGTFGLIRACDKYDPERGFRFSTYASWWIKQAVSRAIADKSRLVRLPVHIHDLMTSLMRVERNFVAQNSRKPSPEELSERLALPLRKVELLVKCSLDIGTIDTDVYNNAGKPPGSGSDIQVKDRLVSQTAEPPSLNEKQSVRSELRRMMEDLNPREAEIIEMRFGLADGTQMTLTEIGKHFRVTRERIRQIEARALSKMRSPKKAKEIEEIFQDHSFVLKQWALWSSEEKVEEMMKERAMV